MKRMYGNIQRVITVASSNASGLRASPEAISHTNTGAAMTPSVETPSSTQNSADAIRPTNTPVLALITAANIGQHRNERLLKRALGKHPAQQVGDAERDVKGVRLGADTEDSRDQHVPREPGEAGYEGQAANGG